MKKYEMIAKCHVLAMLNYIKQHIDDTSRNDMLEIIDTYLRFTNDTTDVTVLSCAAGELPKEWKGLCNNEEVTFYESK